MYLHDINVILVFFPHQCEVIIYDILNSYKPSRSSYSSVPEISIPRLVPYYVILTSFFFPTPMWSDNLWYTKVPIITTL